MTSPPGPGDPSRPDRLTVGLCQWLPRPGAAAQNLGDALDLIDRAARSGAELVVLPELWPCGYDVATLAADAVLAAEPIPGPRTETLAAAARRHSLRLFAGSLPEATAAGVHNTAVAFGRAGELLGVHRKAHLYPTTGEDRIFLPGDRLTVLDGGELGPIGLAVCFDGDFPDVGAALGRRGARLVIEPAAYEVEAAGWWDRLYPAAAVTNAQWWVLANQCGTTSSGTLLGGSRVIDPDGAVVAEATRVAAGGQAEPEVLVCEIAYGPAIGAALDAVAPLWGGRRPELYASAPADPGDEPQARIREPARS